MNYYYYCLWGQQSIQSPAFCPSVLYRYRVLQ